jgi:lipoprotein signal peptidase
MSVAISLYGISYRLLETQLVTASVTPGKDTLSSGEGNMVPSLCPNWITTRAPGVAWSMIRWNRFSFVKVLALRAVYAELLICVYGFREY